MKTSLHVLWSSIAAALLAFTAYSAEDCGPGWDHSVGTPGVDGWVYFMKSYQHDDVGHLYIAGSYTQVDGIPANSIARWDGKEWTAFGQGFDRRVLTVAMYDSGNGPELYAGGSWSTPNDIPYIAKWSQAAGRWVKVGGGLDGPVVALAVYDDGNGPALYAGGSFKHADGKPAASIARWDGQAWSPIGTGANEVVRAMIVIEEEDGAALYVGGNFSTFNGISANRIVRWDGANVTPLGAGLTGQGIRTMEVFDDGSGPQLYVGGVLTTAGGVAINNLARWNLQTKTWSGMGGVNERVVNLRAFDDGSGRRLFIGGWFTEADGQRIAHIGTWDGHSWSTLGSGADSVVRSLEPYDDGNGPALYVGGGFTQMNGNPASGFTRWLACPETPLGDINGDGIVDIADLLLTLVSWGPCPSLDACPADINDDGVVDTIDLLNVLSNWG